MKNYIKHGNTVTLTAPDGGVVSGVGYVIGDLFVVATNTISEGRKFEGQVTGVFRLPKASGALGEGEKVYWDDGNKVVTADDDGGANPKIGGTEEAVGSAAAFVNVRLNGVTLPPPEGSES